MALKEELKSQGDYLFKFRSYLPILLLIFGVWIVIYENLYILPTNQTLLHQILAKCSIFVGLFGLFIRVFTVGYTPANTSGRNTKEGQVADYLNTSGIYSVCRNPLYFGNYLMWLAPAMLTGNIWFVIIFSLIFWIYYERIIFAEEHFLREKFGDTYLNWAKQTPIFIPKLSGYKKPQINFSWKKILKKEKNGLFALFLVFLFFKIVGEYTLHQKFVLDINWLVFCTAATGVLYIILKIVKKYTNALNEKGR